MSLEAPGMAPLCSALDLGLDSGLPTFSVSLSLCHISHAFPALTKQ